MFMCHSVTSQMPAAVASGVLPYFGTALETATMNSALILGLQFRGPTADRLNPAFTLTSGPGVSMYYAYPVSYGLATFLDTDSQMEGGWDGAFMNTTGALGPATVSVGGVPYYLYKTDWPDLGLCHWKAY